MKDWTRRGFFLGAGTATLGACSTGTGSTERFKIDRRTQEALRDMRGKLPFTADLEQKAAGMLVMPVVGKAGLVYGGSYGEGSLLIGGAPVDYYSVASASFGLQIGVQKLSTVLFFMSHDRLAKFRSRNGWTIGADLEYTLIDSAENAAVDSNTYKDEVYGVVFGQKGLHAGVTLEGSKYSRIIR